MNESSVEEQQQQQLQEPETFQNNTTSEAVASKKKKKKKKRNRSKSAQRPDPPASTQIPPNKKTNYGAQPSPNWKRNQQQTAHSNKKQKTEIATTLTTDNGQMEYLYPVKIIFPVGGSCYKEALTEVLANCNSVYSPRVFAVNYQSEEDALEKLDELKKITVDRIPIVADYIVHKIGDPIYTLDKGVDLNSEGSYDSDEEEDPEAAEEVQEENDEEKEKSTESLKDAEEVHEVNDEEEAESKDEGPNKNETAESCATHEEEEDVYAIRILLPDGGSCYKDALLKILEKCDSLDSPLHLIVGYQSEKDALEKLDDLKKILVAGNPLDANYIPMANPVNRLALTFLTEDDAVSASKMSNLSNKSKSSSEASTSLSTSTEPGSVGNTAPKVATPIMNEVYISGLLRNTTEHDLFQWFTYYGNVRATKVIRSAGVSKGYGFVTFHTEEEARRLIQDAKVWMAQRQLHIAPAKRKKPVNWVNTEKDSKAVAEEDGKEAEEDGKEEAKSTEDVKAADSSDLQEDVKAADSSDLQEDVKAADSSDLQEDSEVADGANDVDDEKKA